MIAIITLKTQSKIDEWEISTGVQIFSNWKHIFCFQKKLFPTISKLETLAPENRAFLKWNKSCFGHKIHPNDQSILNGKLIATQNGEFQIWNDLN